MPMGGPMPMGGAMMGGGCAGPGGARGPSGDECSVTQIRGGFVFFGRQSMEYGDYHQQGLFEHPLAFP